jgi:hypothetical protein
VQSRRRTRRRRSRSLNRLHVPSVRAIDRILLCEFRNQANAPPVCWRPEKTFFRHFPAKELVIVDDPYDPAMAQAVAAQSPDLPVVERVRRGLLAAWEQLEDADEAEFRLRLQIGAGHHGLRARMRENNVRTEAAIASALAERGVPAFQRWWRRLP